MASEAFNGVGGFSVGDEQNVVIDDQSNGEFNDLNVNGLTDLGDVGNITILGGSEGSILTTNGFGVLSFQEPDDGYNNYIRVLSRDTGLTSVGFTNGMNINSTSRYYVVYLRNQVAPQPFNILAFTS
jgi:hypothetical protein